MLGMSKKRSSKRVLTDADREFMKFGEELAAALNEYNKSHEDYPIVFVFGPCEDIMIGSDRWLDRYDDSAIRAYPIGTSEAIVRNPNHPDYRANCALVSPFKEQCYYYSSKPLEEAAACFYSSVSMQNFVKNHDLKPRRTVQPKRSERLSPEEMADMPFGYLFQKENPVQIYRLFCQDFAAALNQYNAEHEDYPIIFHMGFDRCDYDPELPVSYLFKDRGILDYTIRAYPINSPAEIVNDSEHPEYERYSKIVCSMEDFYEEHCKGHQNEPDIFDRLVPMWYETYVVNKFAKDNHIASRKKDPWDSVRER